MSLVYVRNAAGSAWVPISHEANAVPGKVNALDGGVFKSICGVLDPTTPRKIRNQANDGWIDLDSYTVLDPPTIIGAASNTRYSNGARCYPASGAQAGDLIVGQCAIRTTIPTTWSPATNMRLLWNFSSSQYLSQVCLVAIVHTGANYYQVGCSEFGNLTTLSMTLRGAALPAALSVGVSTQFPEGDIKTVADQVVTASSQSLLFLMDETNNGVPYTYNSGPWSIYNEYAAPNDNTDMAIANYIPPADGQSGPGQFTGFSDVNAGWTTQVIGVPPA